MAFQLKSKKFYFGLVMMAACGSLVVATPKVEAQFGGRCVPWCPEDTPGHGGGFTGYRSNKPDLRAEVEGGDWVVTWADDISETDVAQGLVAGGVSIYSANPGPFIAWSEYLVDRTLNSLSSGLDSNAQREAERILREVVSRAIQGESAENIARSFDTLDFKAGAIRYSGANYALGNVVSRTWGIKPYIAFRVRSSSNPSVASTISSGAFKFSHHPAIYYSNGSGHYCWYENWDDFDRLTNGNTEWRDIPGTLSNYRMQYDGVCTGGESRNAPHPDPDNA